MKKFLLLLLACVFVFVSCDLNDSGDSEVSYEAPAVASADSMAASGATSYPASSSEAVEVLSAALDASADDYTAAASSSRADATVSYDIDFSESVGGGTVDFDGEVSYSVSSTDTPLVAGTDYPGYLAYSYKGSLRGTITDVTATEGAYNYTVNGEITEKFDMRYSWDLMADDSGSYDYFMDISYSMAYGAALSIRRSDGKGGKFIISYGVEYDEEDIDLLSAGTGDSSIEEALSGEMVELRVYDDNNNEVSGSPFSINPNDVFFDSMFAY